MPIKSSKSIWRNGELIPWDEAKIHVLSHVVHYGTSFFEGLRCYRGQRGSVILRLRDHVNRLSDSAKIYRMGIPYSADELCDAIVETVRANGLAECYIRPLVFRGYGVLGVLPYECPVETYIAAFEWKSYLGVKAAEEGVDVQVSSWSRQAPNTHPFLSKAGCNYMSSQLIRMEADVNGYGEGIALDREGFVSEGSVQNIFVIKGGRIRTPPLASSILPGITRDSVMQIAGDLGYPVIEGRIPRELLYIADEIFLTGSATEIVPVRSVDRIEVGDGKRGTLTKQIQDELSGIIRGKKPDKYGWLTSVDVD
ncbi:branched-chain amino acid aminotransferase [candidate division TA06 bacterium DG_24]|uniref:Branched-chain-amino-acid aminotransferase n=3 Tax=Bacteria division TA06 TaxID=1156500 RepID=A0A0S8JN10_UNCT6|nr:MAG: branched-chain amino acid aminotransferase [candidate division TA06 bacterium DG_24]KPK69481.1 MAG: branched-chain amino acid aminotransferase [candidate division TA06 bacterium SM23_40]KPL10818.1 MAG: branched-chain amino acid aminotransferase [candidate division TA06 bacterium SM1_40]